MGERKSKLRWLIFFSVLFTYLIMSGQRTAPGQITDQLITDFGVTAATIGFVTSMHFFIYTGLQIPMGILADRYGPQFFLIAGAIFAGIGNIMYSLAAHEFILLSSRILTGIGDATIWVNLVLTMGKWFNSKEFTSLIGVAGMTGSLGFLFATVPFSALILLVGWRISFLSVGILLSVCGILLYYVLIKKAKEPLLLKSEKQKENTWILLKKILLNRQAWALFLCHFGLVGGYLGFIGSWAVPYGMDIYGLSRINASQLIMYSLIGALIGAPVIGWISSRLGVIRQPYILFHVIMLGCWASFLLFPSHPPYYFVQIQFIIIGFSFGANSLTFAVIRKSFPKNVSGIVTGFANTGGFLSAVILPGLFGFVLDYFDSIGSFTQGYYFGFVILFSFSMIGLLGVYCIKEDNSQVSIKTNDSF